MLYLIKISNFWRKIYLINISISLIFFTSCGRDEQLSIKQNRSEPVEVNNEDEDLSLNIVGGEFVTAPNDAVAKSTIALLSYNPQAGRFLPGCTGTIIGPNHIVTAAHCVYPYMKGMANLDYIGYGLNANPIPGISVIGFQPFHSPYYADYISSLGYNPLAGSDIAVIIFSGQLPPDLKPVKIAPNYISPGSRVTLAGYGVVSESRVGGGYLRKVDVNIASFHNREIHLQEFTFKGSCYGDSGGPAFFRTNTGELTVAGATSRGRIACDYGNGIYTDIRFYKDWMQCVFKKYNVPLKSLLDQNYNGYVNC